MIFIIITAELIRLGALNLSPSIVLIHSGPLKLLLQSLVPLHLTKIIVSLVASFMTVLLLPHIIARLVKLFIMSERLIALTTTCRLL